MSVRMAIVKLAALGAAGALIGGGAVHMAERAKEGHPLYAKHAPDEGSETVERCVTRVTTRECPVDEQQAELAPQSPPDAAPQPYYATYYASSHHHHHHNVVIQPPYNPPYGPHPGPTPVPAPPMLVLFGAAASSLAARRRLAKQRRDADGVPA